MSVELVGFVFCAWIFFVMFCAVCAGFAPDEPIGEEW